MLNHRQLNPKGISKWQSIRKAAGTCSLHQTAIASLVALLYVGTAAADDSGCANLTVEYRSCSASRTWCGFDTYEPTSPKTKYLTQTISDTAGGQSVSGPLEGIGGDIRIKIMSAPGTVSFGATSTSTNNWDVFAYTNGCFPLCEVGFISATNPGPGSISIPCGAYAVEQSWGNQTGTVGSVSYTPDSSSAPNWQTIQCTEDCVWTTNTTARIVCDYALDHNDVTPTTMFITNKTGWTTATRTYSLSDEYPRSAIISKLASDVASCPTGPFSAQPVQGLSQLSGNTLSLTKGGYHFILNQTEVDARYHLSWKVDIAYADGSASTQIQVDDDVSGNGDTVTNAEHYLMPPLDKDGSATLDVQSIKITVVGGGSACCGGQANTGGGGGVSLGSVQATFPLGNSLYDRGGGQLYISDDTITNQTSTPASLKFAGDVNIFDVITTSQGIRQVNGAQCLADVVVSNSYRYDIRFYASTNVGSKLSGLYTVMNSPFVTWTVLNPDGSAATSRLQIIEIRDSKVITNEFSWSDSTQTWSLTSGNGLRLVTRQESWDSAAQILTQTIKTYTGTNQLALQEIKKYKTYSFGVAVQEDRLGVPGAEVTTTNEYVLAGNGIGRISKVTRSDGSWETYVYNGDGTLSRKWTSCFLTNGPSYYDPSHSREFWYYTVPFHGR